MTFLLRCHCSLWRTAEGLTENDGHEINGHEIDGHEVDGHENDGHEIGGQDIYRLKIDYITMHCAILFKTTAEYKS